MSSPKASETCTSCGQKVDTNKTSSVGSHPLLSTLTCSACLKEYNGGDFSRFPKPFDSRGYDNYCRWCADGGYLIVCDKLGCYYSFCEDCITRNLGKDYFTNIVIKETEWECFSCNPSQIKALVETANAVLNKPVTTPISPIGSEITYKITYKTKDINDNNASMVKSQPDSWSSSEINNNYLSKYVEDKTKPKPKASEETFSSSRLFFWSAVGLAAGLLALAFFSRKSLSNKMDPLINIVKERDLLHFTQPTSAYS